MKYYLLNYHYIDLDTPLTVEKSEKVNKITKMKLDTISKITLV